MSVKLSRQFPCPEEAELHFKQQMKGDVFPVSKAAVTVHRTDQHKVSALEKRTIGTQTEHDTSVVDEILSLLRSMSEAEQLNTVDELLSATVKMLHINIDLPKDFVSKAVAGMRHLKKCQRYNIIYGIVKGFGTMRPDGRDSVIPATRMPTGMLEYTAKFFVSPTLSQVNEIIC